MIIIMVGIVTRRVRRDIRIINRIFNRMLMMVIILNRIIYQSEWDDYPDEHYNGQDYMYVW